MVFPSAREKPLDYLSALTGQHTTGRFHLPVKMIVPQGLADGFHRARLWFGCSVNQSINASVNNGPDAHGAGLKRDVQRCPGQAVVACSCTSVAKRPDFGMGCWIAAPYRPVISGTHFPAIQNNNRPNRDFTGFSGLSRKR
jgi:hypothetical protein